MSRFFRFLFGTCVFSFASDKRIEVLNFLLEEGIGALSCEIANGEGRLTVFRRDASKIPNELCTPTSEDGLLPLFHAVCRRPGLIVGGFLAILLLVLSSLTVWRVEIEGNKRIGGVEIESALAAAGLSVGDFSPSLDISAIKTQFLRENPEISWIGIYLYGTTAKIEVREASSAPDETVSGGFCNLVAAEDGVIERISVDAGRAVVSAGATVRAGDLLISGIYGTATGLRATRAEGNVFARSECTITAFQPFVCEERRYGEVVLDELNLEFFGKNIKVFKKSGKTDAEYDIIKRKEQIVLFGKIALPVFVERNERVMSTLHTVTLDEVGVVRMAFSRLRTDMAARFSNAEVVSERLYAEWTEEGYRLICRVEYISDIATPLAYDAKKDGG